MAIAETIPLSQVVLVDHWHNAPAGALLQLIPPGHKPLVGLKVKFPTSNSIAELVLCIEDSRAGELLDGNKIEPPALDVSALMQICVKHSAPKRIGPNHLPTDGMLLQDENTGEIHMYSSLNSMALLVCMLSGNPGKTGTAAMVSSLAGFVDIGRAIVVPIP